MYRSFESSLVEHCAPTLAGIKPASLFRCTPQSAADIPQTAKHWDHTLSPLGLRVQVLKECPRTGDCIIYVYRPDWVGKLLTDGKNRRFLADCGYQSGDTHAFLQQLSDRLCLEQDYPHEIGLFLGYPLADVIGFIENRGQRYTCCGCWKSYSDPVRAQAYFDRCRQCTSQYRALYAQTSDVLRLVVAA